MMTMNLLRANLDRDTYFKIFELMQRHRRIDVDDFELELIEGLLEVNIRAELDDMSREISEIRDRADSAEWAADEARDKFGDIETKLENMEAFKNFDKIRSQLEEEAADIKVELSNDLANMTRDVNERVKLLCDIAAGMSEVLDFLETRKNMNLRKPKKMPQKTILNLRNKLKVFSM
jgi:hypothetical protein